VIFRRLLSALAIALFSLMPTLCAGQSFELLLKAANEGDVQTVGTLLNQGLDANTADTDGNTILMIAARLGHRDLVSFLIGHKASVRRRSPHGDTALMFASLKGHLEIAELLVRNGAEISHGGWTPLHYAAFEGGPGVVSYLIGKGADKNGLAPNGYTPLMLAARSGQLEAARALLYEDVDLNVRGPNGETALRIAQERKNPELESLLRRAGAVD
jgi:hypothetical protein